LRAAKKAAPPSKRSSLLRGLPFLAHPSPKDFSKNEGRFTIDNRGYPVCPCGPCSRDAAATALNDRAINF
jgi:hypothetical protein